MIKHRFICFFVSLFVRLFDVVCASLGLRPGAKCVVLNYHGVKPEERPQFSEQMDLLIQLARPLPADIECLPQEAGTYVVVTFDDALEGVLQNALPELEVRRIPAAIFVVTEAIGNEANWRDMGASDAAGQKAMSVAQLQSLPTELIIVGSHSMTHPLLPSIGREQLRQEIGGSRAKLEKLLQRKIELFSCPYGVFDSSTIDCCREAGYKRVFTGLADMALLEPNEFVTGRVRTTLRDTRLEFRLKVQGAYRWLPRVIFWKRILSSGAHKAARAQHRPIEERGASRQTDAMLERTVSK